MIHALISTLPLTLLRGVNHLLPLKTWKATETPDSGPLVGVFAAEVGAVAAFGHVEELVDVGVELGDPVTRHQEGRQIEQIHKHFVAVTEGRESHPLST